MMNYTQIAIEYLLVYCTSRGLTAIGEPALPKTYQPVGESLQQCSRASHDPNPDCKQAMPVWIISIFVLLSSAKWFMSFLLHYIFHVISTVTIISTASITPLAAANAHGHIDSQRLRLDRLAWKLKVVGAFKSGLKAAAPIRTSSVVETRQELKRRDTANLALPHPIGKLPSKTFWIRLTSQPCFRGFGAYLTMAIPRWYLSQIIDLILSGNPESHQPGYGTTSIVLATAFGGGFAVWTHYCITRPSNKKIFSHFPKGKEVLNELWPVTAFWAVCEHLPNSTPLMLSRWFGLRAVAFDATAWNVFSGQEQQVKIGEFAIVFLVHAVMVATIAIPATMILRRFYASMLSDEDLAIVPFHRGHKGRVHKYDDRGKLQRPGLTVSDAWGTITWQQYWRVLGVYGQWFVVNQLVQMGYWGANWKLHEVLKVESFASTKLPCSPVGVVVPVRLRNLTAGRVGREGKSEL